MADLAAPVILTIDDEPTLRQSIRFFLEDCNYKVLEAENGRIGLEVFASEKVDLILVDLRMPEMDGLEVLTAVKKIAPDTPIIVISGTGIIADAVEALHLGAWDYLLKPIEDMSILLHAVEQGLEKAMLLKDNKIYQHKLEDLVEQKTDELQASNRELSQINRRLREVVATTSRLTGCGEINSCGSQLLEEFANHMGAEGGSIYLLEEDGLQLSHSLDPGHAPSWIPKPLPEKSVFAYALSQNTPVYYTRIDDSKNKVQPSGWSGYNDHSLLVFQLRGKNNSTHGLIALHSKKDPPFILQDKEIGSILASYTCEAIQAAQANEALRKSEEKLRQAQKMEAIGTLAGGIAHDFNNILAVIMGYSELAQLEGTNAELMKQYLQQINLASLRAKNLVKQILTFSRKNDNVFTAIDISPIIKETLKLMRASLPSSIDIIQDLPGGLGLIMADPTQIHQILMNLCTNSAHAMEDSGGTLTINITREEKENCGHNQNDKVINSPCIHLTVSDTGHGMNQKMTERIFEPYFTTRNTGEGTGLGLAVTHGIVSSIGGIIEVKSIPGHHTTFHLYFPITSDVKKEDTTAVTETIPMGNEHILYIDDEKDLVEMADQMLSSLGYQVTALTNSVEAQTLFRSNPNQFDLVITDQTMPGISGFSLAAQMLKIRADLPIILCTGFSAKVTEQMTKDIGIKRFIMKPWNLLHLAQDIRQLLDEQVRGD